MSVCPDEGVRILADVSQDAGVGLLYSFGDAFGRELVYRIAGDHAPAFPGEFRIEARRAAGTVENPAGQLPGGQAEHRHVFILRAPPRHDVFQLQSAPPPCFRAFLDSVVRMRPAQYHVRYAGFLAGSPGATTLPGMSVEFLLTSLVEVLIPGTGVVYTISSSVGGGAGCLRSSAAPWA